MKTSLKIRVSPNDCPEGMKILTLTADQCADYYALIREQAALLDRVWRHTATPEHRKRLEDIRRMLGVRREHPKRKRP